MSEAAHLIEQDKSGSLWLTAPRRISSSSSVWNAYKDLNYLIHLVTEPLWVWRGESHDGLLIYFGSFVNCWRSRLVAPLCHSCQPRAWQPAKSWLYSSTKFPSWFCGSSFSHLQCIAWRRGGGGGFSPCQGQKGCDSLSECSLTKKRKKKRRSRNSWQRAPVLQSSQIVLLCHGLWISSPSSFFTNRENTFTLLHPEPLFSNIWSHDTHLFSLSEPPNKPPLISPSS